MKTLKLFSSLDCRIDEKPINARKALEYEKQILLALENSDQGSGEKGLMDYIDSEKLKDKILFASASVEKLGHELFGVLTCTIKDMLSENELDLLKNKLKDLYASSWGKSFTQHTIRIPKSKEHLQVSFYSPFGAFFRERQKYNEIESEEELHKHLSKTDEFSHFAFQDIDFSKLSPELKNIRFRNCFFLGCDMNDLSTDQLGDNCHIYPKPHLPFNPFISNLYTKEDLFSGYQMGIPNSYENTLDKKIYNHYLANGKEAHNIEETLFRRMHDHSISDALYDFLGEYDEKRVVAIMGGHSLERGHKDYIKVALISKQLTEKNYLMISGGGPGAMEATHLGAWLAGKSDKELMRCIDILAEAPHYQDEEWLDKAFEVLQLHPSSKYESLGVPTWLYGHEPPTPFATKIAKYFANSVREDGLLAIAKGGVIFSPGNAGTIQEIFQDATQNHYLSYTFASPMVFLNTAYWTKERPVFPLLKKMAKQGKYQNLILSCYDKEIDVVKEIQNFTNIKTSTK